MGFKLSTILQNFKIPGSNNNTRNPIEEIPFSLILLIALLIREDVISVEEIWPYFVKKVRNSNAPDAATVDAADDVAAYHTALEEILDYRYQALERTVFGVDPEAKKME